MKHIALFEILVLVSATLAAAHGIHATDSYFDSSSREESTFVTLARGLFINWFGQNLVSAEEQGLFTCLQNNQGAWCQEYPSTTCNGQCNSTCFPGTRDNFALCQIGTCIDTTTGTCSDAPKTTCERAGGQWSEERPASCNLGCCIAGENAMLKTAQGCNIYRQQTGQGEWQPVTSELQCLGLARSSAEGACVLGALEDGSRTCKFISKTSCQSLQGDFYQGVLCSHPQLNSTCVKQARTSCVEGKDEVYWFDSCGNRENIYDSNRINSWNNGLVLRKEDSCSLSIGSNELARQSSCGNCNYLLGSSCGAPRAGDDQPAIGNAVCRDLSCTDENGKTRKNGESWCDFQSQIGFTGSGNNGRSVDVAGSENYRRSCINGEVITERCGNNRDKICVESRNEQAEFSSAACRINEWQYCIAANGVADRDDGPEAAADKIRAECNKHTDCTLKSVDLRGGRGTFAFNVCVPKYPAGFNLATEEGYQSAQTICGQASIKCTYVKVKGLTSSKRYNQLCITSEGAEAMNNLCMSLGDCGAKVNTEGAYSDNGFRVRINRGAGPEFSNSYIAKLGELNNEKTNQKIQPLSNAELTKYFGSANGASSTPETSGGVTQLETFAMVTGVSGIGLLALVQAFPATVGSIGSYFGIGSAASAGTQAAIYGAAGPEGVAAAEASGAIPTTPTLGAYMGAAAGALIGAAVTGYLIHALGIGAGIPSGITYLLIAGGAFGGGLLGLSLAGGSALWGGSATWFAGLGATGAGLIVIAIVVAIIVILSFLGIGKKKETNVSFQCLPWQPPKGGADCSKCGEDGLGCSRYQCQSLGQTCKFVEDSPEEPCTNVAADDVSAPLISPNSKVLLPGYSYERISDNGFAVRGPAPQGCIQPFTLSAIGLSTNELAECKVTNVHTTSYDDMDRSFASMNGREINRPLRNHTMVFNLLSNETLSNEDQIDNEFSSDPEESGQTFNEFLRPDASGRVNLYVRCSDLAGNKNAQEYNINFCLAPEPDRTPPIILGFTPANPTYAASGATSKNILFYMNEPSECKWSDHDESYETMPYQSDCDTSGAGGTFLGWGCNMTIPLSFGESTSKTTYIRCKDQPWLNNTERNANQQSTSYVIQKTLIPLGIDSIRPFNETVFVNSLPKAINVTVHTSGGAPTLNRFCEYRFGTNWILFRYTGGDEHIQPGLTYYAAGNYTLPIRCYDDAGNGALGEARFNLAVDNQGPAITRVYWNQGQGLTVVTNEEAACRFSTISCSYSFTNGTLMQNNGLVHSSSFSSQLVHYVRCEDRFGNLGACIAVRGAEV